MPEEVKPPKECKHKYFTNEYGKDECKKCTLLRSTIESDGYGESSENGHGGMGGVGFRGDEEIIYTHPGTKPIKIVCHGCQKKWSHTFSSPWWYDRGKCKLFYWDDHVMKVIRCEECNCENVSTYHPNRDSSGTR